ncbi:hypothetical protein [Natrialba taiwanensis]|uniref:Uncharacterized protein n=1 Tax=Natrialba taiwanensis DSM 12281 TaxID=1230458 RepID=M0AC57_9EURY|nr:hypothetical protein [Natrialba taiwanensis]ELY96345.1 hypothetical protein C484_01485 [Natrialba taiwanensis DSM 12281]
MAHALVVVMPTVADRERRSIDADFALGTDAELGLVRATDRSAFERDLQRTQPSMEGIDSIDDLQ